MSTFGLSTEYQTITCCDDKCGITFAAPKSWVSNRQADHKWFFCPNGHRQHWPQESDEERLRRLLKTQEQRADRYASRAEHESRRAAAFKGQVTKVKKRVANGVCPCCNRTFHNLHRHMQSQHPDWAPEKDAVAGFYVHHRGGAWYDVRREGSDEFVLGPIRGQSKARAALRKMPAP